MALDRRRFLLVTTAGMLSSLTETACTGGDDTNAPAEPELVEMLGPERVRQIGTQYRADVPQESSAAALREAISSSSRRGFARRYRRSIEAQIHDDFAASRIVVVSGWVLSLTEARECALYSLSA
ncbi:MAG: hypothetical protein M3P12_13355 [Gemmatimonadota bacterium]|nr:hypothetical protein [Gemmatimonadota bacterium]